MVGLYWKERSASARRGADQGKRRTSLDRSRKLLMRGPLEEVTLTSTKTQKMERLLRTWVVKAAGVGPRTWCVGAHVTVPIVSFLYKE